ncbi:hypothetical protein GCM10028895_47680 [Pontibacter rugosus]
MTIHSAKGLEFPIVILPEVQKPIIRFLKDQEPQFLIVNRDGQGKALPHGLEVKIKLQSDEGGTPLETVSPVFQEALYQDRDKVREDAMRVFYVAITRAEHSVILIGKN